MSKDKDKDLAELERRLRMGLTPGVPDQRALAAQEADPDVRALRLRIVELEDILMRFADGGWVVNSTFCDPGEFGTLTEDAAALVTKGVPHEQ